MPPAGRLPLRELPRGLQLRQDFLASPQSESSAGGGCGGPDTRAPVAAHAYCCRYPLDMEAAQGMIAMVDSDGDGQVDREEFVGMLQKVGSRA